MKLKLIKAGAVVGFALILALIITHKQAPVPPSEGGQLIFEDLFERNEIGAGYLQNKADPGWQAGVWQIIEGEGPNGQPSRLLKAEKIHNAGLWLQTKLPKQVRVEFDAKALSEEGDVKCEIFGDGKTHQSGYILINGGWKNKLNIIARQDEHGEDRKQDDRCPSRRDGKRLCVEPDVFYHWTIERTDHRVLWYIDNQLFLTFNDKNPVMGEHFAFNNWEAPVVFDNLKIYDLSPVEKK
ncbi:hypothetical protein KKF91_08160 [Myxococcota bacterium]|nr:hypothetical protein [Myxococcota bacterium]